MTLHATVQGLGYFLVLYEMKAYDTHPKINHDVSECVKGYTARHIIYASIPGFFFERIMKTYMVGCSGGETKYIPTIGKAS